MRRSGGGPSWIRGWQPEDPDALLVTGHWAVVTRTGAVPVGGVSLQRAAPDDDDLTITCALQRAAWGRGYAAEAGSALLRWAIHDGGAPEVFAIVRSDNTRGLATAQRIGMDWVAERHRSAARTDVFRLRHGDLGLDS